MYAQVALNLPLRQTWTWKVPESLQASLQPGCRVLVPFRSEILPGVVLQLTDDAPEAAGKRVRTLVDALDRSPFIPPAQLQLCTWIARYYHAPIGECVHLAVPAALLPRRGRATWALTPEGKRLHAEPSLAGVASSPAEQAALRLLATRGPGTRDELAAELPSLSLAHLHELEARKLVHVVEQAHEDSKPRSELILHRSELQPTRQLGEKQRLLLDFLDEHGSSSWDELRELYGLARSTVHSLERAGLLTTTERPLWKDPFRGQHVEPRTADPELTAEQQEAVRRIGADLEAERPRTWLLHGVTGSGKTEVYVRLIRQARRRGRRALVLLPEIALTPQFTGVMRSALGENVAVMHSALTPAERRDQWLQIRRGEVGVVIGARSALFAPIEDLGLLIIDEEHDPSFKQNDGVRYHARDAGVVLGATLGCPVVLGSATPSLETLHNARTGKYGLVELKQRVHGRPLPLIELVDLRDQPRGDDGQPPWMTRTLEDAVRQTVSAGEQPILFLNRRGYAPAIGCESCGEELQCPHCEVSLTWHRRGHVVRCHYCGYARPVPPTCPTCGSDALRGSGAGTERIEELVEATFPELRVGRLDRDTARGSGLQTTLRAFRRGELDLLVGTQMVTKGHDFPNVTLVGVLDADQSLRFPDFRGGERTCQLLTQVAGRAGRGTLPGRVIMQAWKPEHPVLQSVQSGDFDAFATHELKLRSRHGYPPFGHVALVRLNAPDPNRLAQAATQLRSELMAHCPRGVLLLGPTEAPIPRLRERYRMQLLLRAQERAPLHEIAALVCTIADRHHEHDIRISLDMDAQSMI